MRKLLLLTILAFLVAIPSVAGGHGTTAKTYTVKTGDDFFSPTKRTIHKRDIVKWVWVGANGKPGQTINEHTIVESKDRFQSLPKTEGTFKYRFKKTGKFTIYCAEHSTKMKLTVTVKE